MIRNKIILFMLLTLFLFCFCKIIFGQEEINISKETNESRMNIGLRQYKAGNYQTAVDFWSKIPENSKYYEKAQKYIEIAKQKIAERDHDKEIEEKKESSETNNYSVYLKQGKEYYEQEEYDKAIQSFKNALRLKPGKYSICYNIAMIYFKKKYYEEAKIYIDKSLSIKPDFSKA